MSVQKILLRHEPKPENLLSVLEAIQKENKNIGPEELKRVAKYFSLPPARIYGLASFFDETKTRKNGKRIIKICSGGPCLAEKSMELVRQVEMLLGVEVENDGHQKYKLEFMSCRGLCDRGPVMMIDKQVFEKVTPETVDDLILSYI